MFTPFAFIQPITTATPITPVTPGQYLLLGGAFNLYNTPTANNIVKINDNGDRDTVFNMGSTGTNGNINDIKQQVDGKYVIGGTFTSYSGSGINRIARLNQNGDRDTTFNVGTGANGQVFAVSPQSDNSNIIGGAFTTYSGSTANRLVKTTPSGARDNSFNIGFGFNSQTIDIITQTDGKIICVGAFTQYSSSNNYITRTNLSGSYNAGVGTSFNTGEGFNGAVVTYATQSDGKILVGGAFTSYSGSSTNTSYLTRLNTNGTQDTTFVTGTGFNTTVNKLLIQSDNKILVFGAFTTYSGSTVNYVTRLNTNGTIDNTFNQGTGFNNNTVDAILQPDNKIVVGGVFTTYSGSALNVANRIVRINVSGTLDTTFNTGVGFGNNVLSLSLQSDNKIIAGGLFLTFSGSSRNYIARLNDSGSYDTSFNIGTGFSGGVYKTTIEQPTGKILAAGLFTSYSGSSSLNATRIIRLNTNGTIDTTFVTGAGLNNYFTVPAHLSVESDGKIYVGGTFGTYSGSTVNNFIRINPSGTIDNTFDGYAPNSSYGVGFSSNVNSIFISGSFIYFGGNYLAYKPTNYIIRLNTDGTQDTTFAIGTGFTNQPETLALQSDGKILVGGVFSFYSGSTSFYMTRLNTDGTRDTTFNMGTGFNSSVRSLCTQSDGKIVVIGNFTSYSGSSSSNIVRINTNGTRDTTFNIGSGVSNLQNTTRGSKVISTLDNKLYVSGLGFSTYSGSLVGAIARINSSGTLDTTFNTAPPVSFNNNRGLYSTGTPGGYSLVLSGSSIIVGGVFAGYKIAPTPSGLMVDATGSYSSSFNIGGGFGSIVRTWATQSDNKILAGGNFLNYNGSNSAYIIRLNTNGTIDNTFNVGTGFNSIVRDLRIQSDGKVIAVGSFTTYSGSSVNGIVRLNISGTIDNTFNVGVGLQSVTTPEHSLIQPDGKIVVVGQFTTYSGSTSNRVVRINTDGTRDTTFNIGTGFNSNPQAVSIQSDGKIVCVGGFTSYSGSAGNSITRINTNGTKDNTLNIGTGTSSTGGVQVLVQPDGKIIFTGNWASYSGSSSNGIVRLNPSGSVDTTFAHPPSSYGMTSTIPNALKIDNEGRIYMGGAFTTYSGSLVNRIVRLTPSGSIDTTFNQAFLNINDTGKGANSTVNSILLL